MAIDKQFKSLPVLFEGGRKAYFYAHYAMIHMYSKKGHKWPLYIKIIGTYDNHLSNWYFIAGDEGEYENILNKAVKKPRLAKEMKEYLTIKKELVVKKLKSFNKNNVDELVKLHKFYLQEFENIMRTSGFLRNLDRGIILKIKQKFRDFENIDIVLRFASYANEKSFSLKEKIATLELALAVLNRKIDLKGTNFKEKIRTICRKFCWTSMGYVDEKPRTENYYIKEIKKLVKKNPKEQLAEIITREKELLKRKKEFFNKLSEKQRGFIIFANKISYLKDYKKECLNIIAYHAEKLFEAIADAIGKDKEFIKDLTHEEVRALAYRGKVDHNLVKKRSKSNVILAMPGEFKILVGKEADIFKKGLLKNQIKDTKEFKGRIASEGIAKGKAKIVVGCSDFKRVNKGDVLIVINTSPDYIDVINKAVAIVAEEGGITTHVSIISRELEKPCIVGLRMATKIFKDGDLVEVDADKGIINIIKKNK